jgi:hypothetical protein
MHWVETTHAVRLHTHRKTVGEGPIYQGRFKRISSRRLADFVRDLPVRRAECPHRRLVKRAQDWPWGSLAERASRRSRFCRSRAADFLSSEAWIHLVNAP